MQNTSKLSILGILFSSAAMLIAAVNLLFLVKNDMEIAPGVAIFGAMVAIFCSNIAIAAASKKKAEQAIKRVMDAQAAKDALAAKEAETTPTEKDARTAPAEQGVQQEQMEQPELDNERNRNE
jgi:hypothetical protein